MVRTFLKHSEEAEEEDELAEIHRTLYDYMLALGRPLESGDTDGYLRQARKKYAKLRNAADTYVELQPEVSGHLNFRMAAQSLASSIREIGQILEEQRQ